MAERSNTLLRRLDRWAGVPLAATSALLRLGRKPVADPPQRVGFLCLGAIGDLLLLSACIAALRERLPRATFVLLTSRANAQAAALVPGLDITAAFGVRQVPAMSAWLRAQRLDLLVDSSQWARLGALLCNLSGAGSTVGFATPGQCRAWGYSRTAQHSDRRHEVENFLALGRTHYPDLTGAPRLQLPPQPTTTAADLLARVGVTDPPERCVCLHMWPSGSQAWLKEWPAAHWDALIRRLAERGFRVCLTGGPGDATRVTAFLREHPDCPAVSLAGTGSLSDLACLFAHIAAVVAVNTGTMHLAALTGAPTVALNGPTNPLRWGPIGPRVRSLLPHRGPCAYLNLGFEYPRPPRPCLDALPVEDVLDALHSLEIF